MKKIIFFLGFLSLAIIIQAQTATPPSAGDGSANNPYQISSINNLYWLQQDSNQWSKHYIQIANIDASATQTWNAGKGWTPIGSAVSEVDYHAFTGTYNGKGYTISNLFCNRPNDFLTGLWGLTYGATIDSVGLVNVNMVGSDETVGALISMCANTTVRHCYSTGIVSGIGGVGGLIGNSFWDSYVDNCYSTCTVSCSDDKVGGLIGKNEALLYNSYATGSVSCTGTQNGNNQAGGLVGKNMSFIKHCYATGNVSGPSQIGGLVGDNNSEDGYNAIIDSCYSTGNISIIGTSDFTCAGGFAGTNMYNSVITNSFSTGNVVGSNLHNQIGGFVGQNQQSLINSSYSLGFVSGGGNCGGFAGSNTDSALISNSYSRGNVVAIYNNIGGFVGMNRAFISKSYSTGSANSTGNFGGFAGSNESSQSPAAINSCFWDLQSSNLSSACGFSDISSILDVIGKTTAEMKTQTTFTYAGWDFMGETTNGTNDYWKIDQYINSGYPTFAWNIISGINDVPMINNQLSIYPNPAQNFIIINLDNNNINNTLSIYNLLGNLIKTQPINQDKTQVDVSELRAGIYLLELSNGYNKKSQKLVIQR